MIAGLRSRLGGVLGEPGSLRRRAISAASWRFGGYGTSQVLRLASNLIMTRLLVPEDFGLMAIIFAVHIGLVMMSDVGLKQSVIRFDEGDQPDFLRTVWTMQVLQFVGLSLLLGAVALALEVAGEALRDGDTVFADPRLPLLLAASISILLLQGLQSMSIALATRRMIIKPLIALELVRQICATAVMICWASQAPSVWALIAGSTFGAAVFCLGSHLVLPAPQMRFQWVRQHALKIWDYGKWLIGSSTAGFIENQGDRFMMGALLPVETFGLYAIAMIWVEAVAGLTKRLLSQIGQPMLNEVRRSDGARLGTTLRRLRQVANLMAAGGLGLVCVLAYGLLGLLYPQSYQGAGPLMLVLALKLIALRYLPLNYFADASGETRRLFYSKLPTLASVFFAIPVAYAAAGLPGALLASATTMLWSAPLQLAIAGDHVLVNFKRERLEFLALLAFAVAWTWVIV